MIAAQPTLQNLLGRWALDPGVIAALLMAGAVYTWGVARARDVRIGGQRRGWPLWRAASFAAGLLTLAVALLSGVDEVSDELLSVHMVQHMMLALLAPVLLLCGAPVRLAFAASSRSSRSALGALLASRPIRTLTHPGVGLALFASVELGTHLTGLYQLALEDETLHALEHAAYFWSGLLLFAPLIAADPLPHPPAPLARFSWMMGAMTAMAVPGAVLTFSESVRYPFYLAPAHALGRSALADQHLAGAIMWVGSGLAMFALALFVTLSAMLAEEHRQRRRELHLDARTALETGGEATARAGVLGG
ncbi:MAG TPA: cytochrome c oxidase assembly protein [Solirubrobacteraceae bacterium]|nr:cytochrome c oxidase assembly protein [Solirubrobacteraceae bacterium]